MNKKPHKFSQKKKKHTFRFYQINIKLQELQLEKVIYYIQNFLIEVSETKSSPSNIFEETFQIDELTTFN
jgi:hypothetical protein